MLLFMMGNSEQILLKKLSTDEIYVLMSFLYSQFLVVFLSAVKAQSTRNVSIYHTEGLCKENEPGRYWAIDCTASKISINNTTQCDARADGESQSESKVKTI